MHALLTGLCHAVVMSVIFTPADYLTGRDWKRWGWPTRSIYATGPAVMALLVLWSHFGLRTPGRDLQWAALGLGWACWRCLFGWSMFGGSMDPQTPAQTWRELARNAVSAIFPFAALLWLGVRWGLAAGDIAAFVVFATTVAYWFGLEARMGHNVDPTVDALHGLGFALIVSIV